MMSQHHGEGLIRFLITTLLKFGDYHGHDYYIVNNVIQIGELLW